MPRSAWRAACSIALAATIGLTSATAGWAQTQQQPSQQQTQPYQQQPFLPQSQPSDTVTRDVLGVFGTTPNQGSSTVARPGAATQAEGGPTVAPAIGDAERRTTREELQPF